MFAREAATCRRKKWNVIAAAGAEMARRTARDINQHCDLCFPIGMGIVVSDTRSVARNVETSRRGCNIGHGVEESRGASFRSGGRALTRPPSRSSTLQTSGWPSRGGARTRRGSSVCKDVPEEWLDAGGFFEWEPRSPCATRQAQDLPRRVRRSRGAAAAAGARLPDEQHRLVRRRRGAQRASTGSASWTFPGSASPTSPRARATRCDRDCELVEHYLGEVLGARAAWSSPTTAATASP